MSIERLGDNSSVIDNMDEHNLRNLIHFYKPELRRIINGESPCEVLSYTIRRKFRRLRVFRDRRGSNQLSEKTLRILKSESQIN